MIIAFISFEILKIKERKTLSKSKGQEIIYQAVLAEKVKVTRQTIHAIEKGRFVPSTALAMKIAFILNFKVDDLFELEKEDWK